MKMETASGDDLISTPPLLYQTMRMVVKTERKVDRSANDNVDLRKGCHVYKALAMYMVRQPLTIDS